MSERTESLRYTPFFPAGLVSEQTRNHDKKLFGKAPPEKPDWLLIFMTTLFLLTLLLLWIVDIPSLMN